jgi:hypothetical protein
MAEEEDGRGMKIASIEEGANMVKCKQGLQMILT